MWASSFIHLCTCTHVRTHTHTHTCSIGLPPLLDAFPRVVCDVMLVLLIHTGSGVCIHCSSAQTDAHFMHECRTLSLSVVGVSVRRSCTCFWDGAGGRGGGGSGCIWRAEGWRVEGVSGLWFGVFRLVLDDSGPEPAGDIPFSG